MQWVSAPLKGCLEEHFRAQHLRSSPIVYEDHRQDQVARIMMISELAGLGLTSSRLSEMPR